MQFTLVIRLDDDKMQTGEQLAEAIESVRRDVDFPVALGRVHTNSVFDSEGNRVGGWRIEEEF